MLGLGASNFSGVTAFQPSIIERNTMTTNDGGTIPHAQTTSTRCGNGPETSRATDWRTLPRYERTHDTITEGDVIGVRLSNRDGRAWVDLVDYQRIVATHGAIRWFWHDKLGSVVLRDRPRHCISVARLILGEEAKGFVQYGGQDRLNLRRVNLSVDATKRPRRDGLTKVRTEKAAQLTEERAGRKALRAEKAAKAGGGSPHGVENRSRKRVPSGPTVRSVPPPPPLSALPQIAQEQRSAPRRVNPVVTGVKRKRGH